MKTAFIAIALLVSGLGSSLASAMPSDPQPITIRTEEYPRPSYSGATYFFYEQEGATICTKLEVCNKYDQCETNYYPGLFKAAYDQLTGEAYNTTPAVEIRPESLKKHVCLTKFGLN